MSCLNCYKKPIVKRHKNVTFSETVNVRYFNKIPLESNVCWQQVARDRLRFKRRVLGVEKQIKWVFATEHRNRVYNKLYL